MSLEGKQRSVLEIKHFGCSYEPPLINTHSINCMQPEKQSNLFLRDPAGHETISDDEHQKTNNLILKLLAAKPFMLLNFFS
ncbi:hypothetical protein [Pantoea ananatis]|uniref:hypothetical protein n=1 Tax=Pantoea ananas TaxID=553 RepID=UPI001B3123F6|nr:hypothetical protein [Pantoea ananatis]MDN4129984.1 hypothetical protein [Pantoea ananatis]MDN4154258.1 hypothetical protein [Pantoea ananatis]